MSGGHHHAHGSLPTHGAMNLSFGCAVAANLLFTVFEAVLAFKAGSVGLLADAGGRGSMERAGAPAPAVGVRTVRRGGEIPGRSSVDP